MNSVLRGEAWFGWDWDMRSRSDQSPACPWVAWMARFYYPRMLQFYAGEEQRDPSPLHHGRLTQAIESSF